MNFRKYKPTKEEQLIELEKRKEKIQKTLDSFEKLQKREWAKR